MDAILKLFLLDEADPMVGEGKEVVVDSLGQRLRTDQVSSVYGSLRHNP
jgi:hypothetical protein